MSKQIDERVVSMQFENRQFEANARTSMSTLDKLKEKLNFKGVAKGVENLETAVKKVDLSPIGHSADKVGLRFSAMYTIADQTFRNIVNSAEAAAKRMVSAFTTDPIKTGLSEYETKINAVQVIKANTRGKFDDEAEQMETIYSALDELNTYADKTIYNFAQMTDNVGKFVAQTGDIEKSVKAVQGLANLAGASGASAADMARATYQMSQALSGTIRKIDWNSLRNANMASLELKGVLTDLAKLKGIDIDGMIATKGTFEDTLEEGWLTGDMFMEAMNIYSNAYSEAELAAMGFSEAQIKNFKSIAKTAEEATTEVKTYTQLMDVLKETAQSGWTRTWELIFGEFDQAKQLWSGIYRFFGGVIERSSEARNKLLEGALGNPFSSLLGRLESSEIGKTISKVSDLTDKLEHYQDVVNRVWRGDYKNADTGRFELLSADGYDSRIVQDLVNKGNGYKLTVDDITESYKKFGIESEIVAQSTKDLASVIDGLTDAELENLGYTKDEIKLLRELASESKKTGKPLEELAKSMSEMSGREKLIESFKNAGSGLVSIFTAMKDAWREIFPPMTSVQLYNIISSIHDLSQHLVMGDETAGKLKRTFKGLFAILDVVTTLVGGGFKIAFKAAEAILGMFGLDILDALAYAGDAAVAFRDWMDSILDFNTIFQKLASFCRSSAEAIGDWVQGMKEAENIPKYILSGLINGLSDGASSVLTTIWNLGKNIISKICEVLGIHSPSTVFFAIGGFIITGLIGGLTASSGELGSTLRGIATSVSDTVMLIFEKLIEFIKKLDLGTVILTGLGVGTLITVFKVFNTLGKFANPLESLSDMFKDIGGAFKSIGNAVALKQRSKALLNIAISVGVLVAALYAVTKIAEKGNLWESVGVLAALAGVVLVLAGAMYLMTKNDKEVKNVSSNMMSVIGLAASISLLVLALKMLSDMEPKQMLTGIIGLGAIIAGLVVVVAAFGTLVSPQAAKDISGAGSMFLKMAIAMAIMVAVIKIASKLSVGEIKRGLLAVGAIELLFIGMVAVSNVAGQYSSKAGSMLLKMTLALGMMLVLISIASKLDIKDVAKGILVVGAIEILFLGIIAVSKLAGEHISKAGTMMLSMAIAMGIIIGIINMISGINNGDLARGLIVITAIGIMFVAMMKLSNFAEGAGENASAVGTMLLKMSAAMLIMAGVIFLMSLIKPDGLARATLAIGILEACFIGLISVTKTMQTSKDMNKTLLYMIVAIGLLVASVVGLTFLDPKKVMTATMTVTALMSLFMGMLVATKFIKDSSGMLKAVGSLALMAGVLALFVAALYFMPELPAHVEGTLKTVLPVITLMTILAGLLTVMGMAKGGASFVGIASLVLMVGPLIVFALAIRDLPTIPNHVSSTLNILLPVITLMTLLLAPLTLMGLGGAAAIIGVGSLVLMVGPLVVFALALRDLPAIPNHAVETFDTLFPIIVKMTAVLGALTLIGLGGSAALTGIGSLTAMVVALGALVIAIGALLDSVPDLEYFLDVGIGFFSEFVGGIGEIFGSFVTGFAGGMFSILPDVGEALSDFWDNASVFVEGVKDIDASVMNGIKSLSEAILILTAANLIEGLTSLFAGESSLSAFGDELTPLGEGIRGFVDALGTFDETQCDTVEVACDAIKMLASAANEIPNEGGLFGRIFGENGIWNFAKQLPATATSLKNFMINLGSFEKSKLDTVNVACGAIDALASAAKKIPNDGGLWGRIFGENSIADFGDKLPGLGEDLNAFVGKIGELTADKLESVKLAVKIIETLASMASLDLKKSAEGIDAFGFRMEEYGARIASTTKKIVYDSGGRENLTTAIKMLNDFKYAVRDMKASDVSNLESFGSKMESVSAGAIQKFIDAFTANGYISDLRTAVRTMLGRGVTIIQNSSQFNTAGEYAVDGFVKGIGDNTFKAEAEAAAMAAAAYDAAMRELDAHSPSRKFMKAGGFAGLGFVKGLISYGSDASKAGSGLAESSIDGLKMALSSISGAVNGGMELQPRIQPVLDFSGVRSGASAIGGLFSGRRTITVDSTAVGAVAASMAKTQNGMTMDDVVSSIKALRKDMANMPRESISVGNVTYDDGSNIADAVRTIVRATRIERRT